MIGSGLKKLAKEHGMTVSSGIAYGSFYGYAATFYEGNGWKEIAVSCLFPAPQKTAQLQTMLDSSDLQKQYRILSLTLTPTGMRIRFYDTIGTMKRIIAFSQWFFPQLADYGVTGADICPQCGMPIGSGDTWQLVDDVAVHMHTGCADRLQYAEARKMQAQEEDAASTSYMSGTVGAVIGAVIWGAVLYMGYFASLVGILIGFLASKGYDLTRGKQQKGKIGIILVVTVLAVIAGTLGAYGFELIRQISVGSLPGYAYGDVFWMLGYMLQDGDFAGEVVRQVMHGLLYALLGVSVVLVRVHKDTKNSKMKQLK